MLSENHRRAVALLLEEMKVKIEALVMAEGVRNLL